MIGGTVWRDFLRCRSSVSGIASIIRRIRSRAVGGRQSVERRGETEGEGRGVREPERARAGERVTRCTMNNTRSSHYFASVVAARV